MSSPVSVVVAEIVMQSIGEQALATFKQTVALWLRYVDDTFTAVTITPSTKIHVASAVMVSFLLKLALCWG